MARNAQSEKLCTIGFQYLVPLLVTHFEGRSTLGASGRIYEDVCAAKFFDHRVAQSCQTSCVSHVRRDGQRTFPQRPDLSGCDSTGSVRRPVGATFAPARAKPSASANPIPDVPPMTTAVLLFRS